MPVAAIDFDGTITLDDCNFPDIGTINPDAKLAHDLLRKYDWKLILWTCRNGIYLSRAIDFSLAHGIKYDSHNDHLLLDDETDISGKVFANVYIDDRGAGIPKKTYLVPNRGQNPITAIGVDWMAVLKDLRIPTT